MRTTLLLLALLPSFPATAQRPTLPTFTTTIASKETAKAFRAFIDKNRGKFVEITIEIDPRYSKLIGEDLHTLFVQEAPCDAEPSDCVGSFYVLSGKSFIFSVDKRNFRRLDGYFKIGKDIESRQGEYFNLQSVSAEALPRPPR